VGIPSAACPRVTVQHARVEQALLAALKVNAQKLHEAAGELLAVVGPILEIRVHPACGQLHAGLRPIYEAHPGRLQAPGERGAKRRREKGENVRGERKENEEMRTPACGHLHVGLGLIWGTGFGRLHLEIEEKMHHPLLLTWLQLIVVRLLLTWL